jgi:segregation and condensation protein B
VDDDQQRRIVEAVILASPEPISAARIAELIPRCNPTQVRAHVKALCETYVEDRRAFEIWEVAGGYQFRSLAEFAPYLKQIQKTRPLRLSQAALETLAVVAYRQPVTRAEVEHVRGVDGGAVLRSLLERDLVRIAGHREVAGRPIVYATSRRFLEVFGLPKLADLPNLRDVEALSADTEGGPTDATLGDATQAGDGTASADGEASEAQADAEEDAAAESAVEGRGNGAAREEPAAPPPTPPGSTH